MAGVRRRTLTAVLLMSALLSSVPAGAATPTPADCARTLACTAADINEMTVPDRLAFVRDMETGPAQQILPGFDRWRNIEGVLELFTDLGWSTPGSWASTVDGGILEGAERGLAIALGRSTDTFGNPGAPLWARYLTGLHDGALTGRAAHDHAWGEAEQTSTDYGQTVAAALGRQPTDVQSCWFQFTQLYRFMLINRPAVLDEITVLSVLDPNLAKFKIPFYDWATDVRTDVPARNGGMAFYQLCALHVIGEGESATALLTAYLPVMFAEFKAETGL